MSIEKRIQSLHLLVRHRACENTDTGFHLGGHIYSSHCLIGKNAGICETMGNSFSSFNRKF